MSLEDILAAGSFAFTAEVTPPLSADEKDILEKAMPLKGFADAVNVTDGASARAHMSSVAAAVILARAGIEPVMQMTCRDRNRLALESDLLGAAALGVRNVLMLRGDDPTAGDQPDAKPVFDLESRDLLAIAARMRDRGELPSGRAIVSPPKLFLGATDVPVDPKPGWKPTSLLAKADAGAQFIQTQFCFDIGLIARYMGRLAEEGLTERLGFLLGIGPLRGARSARWMRENLFGTVIPDAVIDRLEGAADPVEEGIAICVELLQQIAEIPGVAGAHLMAPLNESAVPETIERSGLKARRAA